MHNINKIFRTTKMHGVHVNFIIFFFKNHKIFLKNAVTKYGLHDEACQSCTFVTQVSVKNVQTVLFVFLAFLCYKNSLS